MFWNWWLSILTSQCFFGDPIISGQLLSFWMWDRFWNKDLSDSLLPSAGLSLHLTLCVRCREMFLNIAACENTVSAIISDFTYRELCVNGVKHNLLAVVITICFILLWSSGEMQRAAKPSGDLWEDGGGAGARSDQAHEVHVLPGNHSAEHRVPLFYSSK